jgi:hypothetical protein
VAFGGWYINYRLFRTNGILWSLAASALVVPVIDVLLPAARYQWGREVSRLRGLAATPSPANPQPSNLATA